jgi:Fe-S cluster assembly protein SufD
MTSLSPRPSRWHRTDRSLTASTLSTTSIKRNMMSNEVISYFSELFTKRPASGLSNFNQSGLSEFKRLGIPAAKHEEWRYTRVSSLFRKDLLFLPERMEVAPQDIDSIRIPGHKEATELVFVNGVYRPGLSTIRHEAEEMAILTLDDAAGSSADDSIGRQGGGRFAEFISGNIGHSGRYHPDGIHALNAAFSGDGVFIVAKKGKIIQRPVYIYHVSDSRKGFIFSQPRSLVHVEAGAHLRIAETYHTFGGGESFSNEVFEIVAERDSVVDYYKIQDEGASANHVGTTHIRQIGKCLTNAVTVTLSGAIVRNNLNMVMEAEHGESHMYGLYLLDGKTHADNHTIVDNVMPNCYSNELYKGIMEGESTGVFNGKIFVRKDAQKTNAYQSNKNILLGDKASAYTKPQLEIFADDVKCSHGCTVGRLDDEAFFYLRARGLGEKSARALLLHAFAVDILEKIKLEPLRTHVDGLISDRLEFQL